MPHSLILTVSHPAECYRATLAVDTQQVRMKMKARRNAERSEGRSAQMMIQSEKKGPESQMSTHMAMHLDSTGRHQSLDYSRMTRYNIIKLLMIVLTEPLLRSWTTEILMSAKRMLNSRTLTTLYESLDKTHLWVTGALTMNHLSILHQSLKFHMKKTILNVDINIWLTLSLSYYSKHSYHHHLQMSWSSWTRWSLERNHNTRRRLHAVRSEFLITMKWLSGIKTYKVLIELYLRW